MTKTQYSISAASRISGKSRATISRHIKSGKLSCELDRDENKVVNASELVRVYGNECDFAREELREDNRGEKRGVASDTAQSESQDKTSHAAIEAVREQQISQYVAQIEHLQQALDKAQDSQNRITLLLEQRSSDSNDWESSLETMASKLANQTQNQIEELRANHTEEILKLKRALHRERNKSLWRRLFA